MLSTFATTEWLESVNAAIASEDRLSELVAVYDVQQTLPESSGLSLIVNARGIVFPIDWQGVMPPYLLPEQIAYSESRLLGIIFGKLGNLQKATEHLVADESLLADLRIADNLLQGARVEYNALTVHEETAFENYRRHHNTAVLLHYGNVDTDISFDDIASEYREALFLAPNVEHKAFTIRHYASLLLDVGMLDKAYEALNSGIAEAVSDEAKYGLKAVLVNVWMRTLTVPYDRSLLSQLKDVLWDTLQYFETHHRKAEAGMLYLDAAHIANIAQSFAEALGYVTKAIRIFEDEELDELEGNAYLRKGTLLYTWAQNGNPQFYKPAIDSYHRALKTFRQEATPDVFADIHHHLGVLYAEMPVDEKKRGVWAGVSAASFQEALNYYTKEDHPYSYGMVCNNYGNALMRFPQAIHSDNNDKALYYYQEALDVRPPEFPNERAITLLNFLEASWNISNASEEFNEERYLDMIAKAHEVKSLTLEISMIETADKHLEMLAKLRESFAV